MKSFVCFCAATQSLIGATKQAKLARHFRFALPPVVRNCISAFCVFISKNHLTTACPETSGELHCFTPCDSPEFRGRLWLTKYSQNEISLSLCQILFAFTRNNINLIETIIAYTMNSYPKTTAYTSFKRYCKVLKLQDNKSLIEKYKEVHKPGKVWPEITRGIREVGILDMEIYIHGNHVFMIMDTVPDFDHDKAMKELAASRCRRSGRSMFRSFSRQGRNRQRRRSGR